MGFQLGDTVVYGAVAGTGPAVRWHHYAERGNRIGARHLIGRARQRLDTYGSTASASLCYRRRGQWSSSWRPPE